MGGFQFLYPEPEAKPENKVAAEQINDHFRAYGLTEQAGRTRTPDKKTGVSTTFGPQLGPVNPPWRDDAFIRKCSDVLLNPESTKRIQNAMNCSACHSGTLQKNAKNKTATSDDLKKLAEQGTYELKPLYLSTTGFNDFILRRVIVDAHTMPLGSNLSAPEREALLSCLKFERNESFKRALEPKGCRIFKNEVIDPNKELNTILGLTSPPKGTESVTEIKDSKVLSGQTPTVTGAPKATSVPTSEIEQRKDIPKNQ